MNSFIKTTKKCRKGFHHNKSSGTCSRTLKLDRDSHRLEKIIKSPAFKKKVKDLIEKPVPKEAFKEYFNGEMAGGNSVSSTDKKHILSEIKDNLYDILNAIKIRLLTGVPPDVPQELAEEIISSPTKSLSIKSPASIKSMTIKTMSPIKSMSHIKSMSPIMSIKSIGSLPKSVKSSLSKSINSIKSYLPEEEEEEYKEELVTDSKTQTSLYNAMTIIASTIAIISLLAIGGGTYLYWGPISSSILSIIESLTTLYNSQIKLLENLGLGAKFYSIIELLKSLLYQTQNSKQLQIYQHPPQPITKFFKPVPLLLDYKQPLKIDYHPLYPEIVKI